MINTKPFYIVTAVVNILLDAAILGFAQIKVWGLHLDHKRKLLLSLMFLIGTLAFVGRVINVNADLAPRGMARKQYLIQLYNSRPSRAYLSLPKKKKQTVRHAFCYAERQIQGLPLGLDFFVLIAPLNGIVAENAELLASMRRIGHLMDMSQAELLALLDYYCDPSLPLLPYDQAQVLVGLETPSAVRAKNIDLHHAIHRPLFRQLFRMDATSSSLSPDQVAAIDHASKLKHASTSEEAADLVTGWFRSKVAQVLGLKEAGVDPERPVHTYGMDSLVAIDLKNWFSREIGTEVQVFVLLGNKTLASVAKEAAEASRFRSVSTVTRH
ncbi:hypothetical protein HD806DRAFT_529133 [Xylariaceae sp. AK1471]|nr:hypothetical protein HD806DRAFT_529133 [Xylariaceae sp. AK1471]